MRLLRILLLPNNFIGVYPGNGATFSQGYSQDISGGGVYADGTVRAVVTNCIITGNSAANTGGGVYGSFINGSAVNGCALSNNVGGYGGGAYGILTNCLLVGNSAGAYGGGVFGSVMYNCTLIGNVSRYGGGAEVGILRNCLLISNWAYEGGGAFSSRLLNCTVAGNFATNQGGGTVGGNLTNCIVYDNSSPAGVNWVSATNFNYCCTTPLPPSGPENFTNWPGFIDEAAGNFRLQANSPCINSGNNSYVDTRTDLDGLPRIVGGTVDVGAYEFQGSGSLISYAWLQQYGLPTDGSADFVDTDGDGMDNWKEWICGTDPTNPGSVLKMLPPVPGAGGVAAPWQSVTNRNYFLQRATNLGGQPGFVTLATNIPGQLGTTTFADTNLTSLGPAFYRVGVQR